MDTGMCRRPKICTAVYQLGGWIKVWFIHLIPVIRSASISNGFVKKKKEKNRASEQSRSPNVDVVS